MGYAKASSQQFKLIDQLPELSDLEVKESQIIPEPEKYDKFLMDKHKAPIEAGMSTMNNSITKLNYPDQDLQYTISAVRENTGPILENETKLIVEDEIDLINSNGALIESKNYKEPQPSNLHTPWGQPQPNIQYPYYNNPYNQQATFPVMSNYNPHVQVPTHHHNNYNNITNGYSLPVNHYQNVSGQFSVPIENFDTTTSSSSFNTDGAGMETPESLQNRNGELSTRKLKKTFKKFNSNASGSDSSKSPWSSQWNNCVAVSDHIKSCPVCSKLYNNNNNQIIYIIIIVILLIVCLILLQKVLTV